jgi:hypothetical protein
MSLYDSELLELQLYGSNSSCKLIPQTFDNQSTRIESQDFNLDSQSDVSFISDFGLNLIVILKPRR